MATQAQKDELLAQAKAHYAADMLLKGTYADDEAETFRGCSVGCHIHHIRPDWDADDIRTSGRLHELVAEHYGYPAWLALLQDTIFEGLPNGESAKWHVQLAETLHALPDDHDWTLALHRAHAAILRVSYRTAGEAQDAVHRVLELHEKAANGEDVTEEMWSAARSAAWSAAWSAARSAARSAWSAARSAWSAARSAWSAKRSAESAAESAAWSAESAAWSAAESAAWSAARSAESAAESAAYQEIRDAVLGALPEPIVA
jgi:hypothetical protein